MGPGPMVDHVGQMRMQGNGHVAERGSGGRHRAAFLARQARSLETTSLTVAGGRRGRDAPQKSPYHPASPTASRTKGFLDSGVVSTATVSKPNSVPRIVRF